jgi:hypothetical protein
MKHKYSIISSCFALALAGSAPAAGVWSSINWTDDSSLSFITSTNVTHSGDFSPPGASAPTINGFTFETISIVAGFGSPGSPITGSNFTVGSPGGTFTFDGSAGVSGTASSLLSTGLTGGGGAGSSTTFNLTGLLTNTDYTFYFFNPDWGNGSTRTGLLDGSDDGVGNTFAVDQNPGTGNNIVQYAYNTGASTTFTMTVTSDTGDTLHKYAFVNVVPEPSTALLGGLGMLALLRRRR